MSSRGLEIITLFSLHVLVDVVHVLARSQAVSVLKHHELLSLGSKPHVSCLLDRRYYLHISYDLAVIDGPVGLTLNIGRVIPLRGCVSLRLVAQDLRILASSQFQVFCSVLVLLMDLSLEQELIAQNICEIKR